MDQIVQHNLVVPLQLLEQEHVSQASGGARGKGAVQPGVDGGSGSGSSKNSLSAGAGNIGSFDPPEGNPGGIGSPADAGTSYSGGGGGGGHSCRKCWWHWTWM